MLLEIVERWLCVGVEFCGVGYNTRGEPNLSVSPVLL